MSIVTRITIADYDRMIAEGYFDAEEGPQRIELIDGELCPMSPIGPLHDWLVDRLNRWSCRVTSEDVVAVRIQGCVEIRGLRSVPQPDVLWVRQGEYRTSRPTSSDALLIVEVAESSLAYDCGRKANKYATGGVADYWVVNIPDECVEVFRQPENRRYRSRQVFKTPDTIHPLAFPEICLPVAELFPADA